MLFVSDLDRTLIYSRRAFWLGPGMDPPPHSLAEVYNGEEISFIADEALGKLRLMAEKMAFAPVTTRTVEQYQRVSLFQKVVVPRFAVVSNGGNILIDGRIDEVWAAQIRRKKERHCLADEALLAEFAKIKHSSWLLTQRQADQLFYYCIVERSCLPYAELADFRTWAAAGNWTLSLQGRKLYLVPSVVNKADAVLHIKERLHASFLAAAGDSLLDLCVLDRADYAIAPCHGEIWDRRNELQTKSLHFTQKAGIFAAGEILDKVNEIYKSR